MFGVHLTWHPDPVRVDRLVAEVESVLAPFAPRPHWGKVFGPDHDWAALYPRLADFRRLVERFDPDGVFRNDYLRQTVLAERRFGRPRARSRTTTLPPCPPPHPPRCRSSS